MKIQPSLNMNEIEQEDRVDKENAIPPRFGFRHPVNYTLENSGEWTLLPDGDRIWRLSIHCPDAKSINLLYDKYWVPDGAKLFIYSSNRKHSIGAFTSANNFGDRNDIHGFATGLVYGDQITLEYWVPDEVKEVGIISIDYVVHGYRHIVLPEYFTREGYGQSLPCNINVNCFRGEFWQSEKNAVALIVKGENYCSGSLINTTANNYYPYFLTADHCLEGMDAEIHNSPMLTNWVFYWQFEAPTCTNAVPVNKTTTGAKLIANNDISDFALLDLSGQGNPRNLSSYIPYYLGWDRSGNTNAASTSGVCIHHPFGDIKKICFSDNVTNFAFAIPFVPIIPDTHWRVLMTNGNGTTENGSSGSSWINNSHRVIGQLHGGDYGCPNPNLSIYKDYGKFSVSWYGSLNPSSPAPSNKKRLYDWLAPGYTATGAPLTTDGTFAWPITGVSISGPSIICGGFSGTFTTNALTGFTWSCSSTLSLSSTIGNSVQVYGNNLKGPGWVKINYGTTVVAQHNYTVSGITITPQNGSTNVGVQETFTASVIGSSIPFGEGYDWDIQSGPGPCSISTSGPNGSVATITFSQEGSYTVRAMITTTCGTEISGLTVYARPGKGGISSVFYPNPVNDILYVDLDKIVKDQQKTAVIYDVLLYDSQSKMVRQTNATNGVIQFNVSNLPDGIYFLHIHDGSPSKPEVHRFIIKH